MEQTRTPRSGNLSHRAVDHPQMEASPSLSSRTKPRDLQFRLRDLRPLSARSSTFLGHPDGCPVIARAYMGRK